jgi:hypothetical protein
MSKVLILGSLAASLSAIVYGLSADLKGWNNFNFTVRFLVMWLPGMSLLATIVLWFLAARAGLKWTTIANLILFLAGGQVALLLLAETDRLSFYFLPAMNVLLCAAAWAVQSRPADSPPAYWISRPAPYLALAGLLAVAGAVGAREMQRRQEETSRQIYLADEARKDATLRGLERAAWLLRKEFFLEESFQEAEFLRTGVYRRPRDQGEYRWDEAKGRLLLRLPLFTEPWRREQILPFAGKALQTAALRPGPHPELDGGILECRPPLDCSVTWEFDVEKMHPFGNALQPSVAALENLAGQQTSR